MVEEAVLCHQGELTGENQPIIFSGLAFTRLKATGRLDFDAMSQPSVCILLLAAPDSDPSMNLYVSNLAYSVTDDELRSEFAAYGDVSSARVVMDRETGRSRGFGFVDMPNDPEAKAAISNLEGTNLAGRALKIVEARPKEDRPRPQVGGGGYPENYKKKADRGHAGGFRKEAPVYNDWDDRDRGGKGSKPRDRNRGNHQENDWD